MDCTLLSPVSSFGLRRQLDFFAPPKFSAFDTTPLFSSYLSLFLVGFFRIAGNGFWPFPGRINPRHPPTSKDRVLTVLVSVAHVSLIALMSHGLFSLTLGFCVESLFLLGAIGLFPVASPAFRHLPLRPWAYILFAIKSVIIASMQ